MAVSMKRTRTPSPSPTVTLDPHPKQDLQRSSSEDSIRVIHHAVLFPSSKHAGRVTYVRRMFETDAELIKRQQAAIALQPLTYAEELKARRKQLEIKAEKRKQAEKTTATNAENAKNGVVPEIAVIPASGKSSLPPVVSPVKAKPKDRATLHKEKIGTTQKNLNLKHKQTNISKLNNGQNGGKSIPVKKMM